ncbi:hypothetical protein ACP70R_007811 [Stipagrostis hirtigluma subsp. patula]
MTGSSHIGSESTNDIDDDGNGGENIGGSNVGTNDNGNNLQSGA